MMPSGISYVALPLRRNKTQLFDSVGFPGTAWWGSGERWGVAPSRPPTRSKGCPLPLPGLRDPSMQAHHFSQGLATTWPAGTSYVLGPAWTLHPLGLSGALYPLGPAGTSYLLGPPGASPPLPGRRDPRAPSASLEGPGRGLTVSPELSGY